jgi:malate synthase
MKDLEKKFGIRVSSELVDFIEHEVLPQTNITADKFWFGLARIVTELTPTNNLLLEKRTYFQNRIDEWHRANKETELNFFEYKNFLASIGYIVPEKEPFCIDTDNVDPEISNIAGPQLVVPIMNARFALNAANARWGSVYDALYGTDVIEPVKKTNFYDLERGKKVIQWGRSFLDDTFPLIDGSWSEITEVVVRDGSLDLSGKQLQSESSFTGYVGNTNQPTCLVLRNNNLHVRIEFDRGSEVGQSDLAGISDIVIESAISTIMDCEDSISAVDASDKIIAYRNWLGMMKGDLTEKVIKEDGAFTRKLNDNFSYYTPSGNTATLKGTSLMLVRNVGHLMTTPTVLDQNGDEVFEGLLDAICTVTMALHDLNREGGNSSVGSVYVVKPKMHGPDEVAFACRIFELVEEILGLPLNTVKLGIMDEERRTSVNLSECIRVAKSRVVFINTGFLDRTGDEIHTNMQAGPMLRKSDMKNTNWIQAYENRNVQIGLKCGLQGRAQIGKGMWAMPDLMSDMLAQKINHPLAGANCAWVPSPTAATLHATHYHKINVQQRQDEIRALAVQSSLDDLLQIPLQLTYKLTASEIQSEIENNCQGILGYVVRWVDQGIGCSKVPDIHNVQLMEDRATCRISSQSLSNWLCHNFVDHDVVVKTLKKMAAIVDLQNAGDVNYRPMSPNFDTEAFLAAYDLIFSGETQPSGYTEPILHRWRLELKSKS